jgi:Mg-chelatase subunit ChlD
MLNQSQLKNTVRYVVEATAGSQGFTSEFGPYDTASINFGTKTYKFPDLPINVEEEDIDLIKGYMYHEFGHFEKTDPEVMNELVQKPHLKNLDNTLEDIWIDEARSRENVYVAEQLENLSNIMLKRDLLGQCPPDTKPFSVFTNYVLNYGYSSVVGHTALSDATNSDESQFIDLFGKPLLLKVKATIQNIINCRNSFDVLGAADFLYNSVKEYVEEEKQKKDGQQSGQDSGQQSGQQSGQDSGQQSGQDSGQQSGQQSGQPGNNGSLTDEQIANIESFLNDDEHFRTNDARSEAVKSSQMESNSPAFNYRKPQNPQKNGSGNAEQYMKLPALGLQLQRLFISQNKRQIRQVEYGTRLHRRFPIAVSTNDKRLFRKKTESKSTGAHISFAWDMSGSMNVRGRYPVSRDAIISLVMSIERTRGLSSSVCTFNDSLRALKLENQSFNDVKGNFYVDPKGGTRAAPGIYWCMEQCFKSKANRQVIIVITDGEPGDSSNIQEMNQICEKVGIEIYAIGLLDDAVKKHWENSHYLQDIDDLPKVLTNIINR